MNVNEILKVNILDGLDFQGTLGLSLIHIYFDCGHLELLILFLIFPYVLHVFKISFTFIVVTASLLSPPNSADQLGV